MNLILRARELRLDVDARTEKNHAVWTVWDANQHTASMKPARIAEAVRKKCEEDIRRGATRQTSAALSALKPRAIVEMIGGAGCAHDDAHELDAHGQRGYISKIGADLPQLGHDASVEVRLFDTPDQLVRVRAGQLTVEDEAASDGAARRMGMVHSQALMMLQGTDIFPTRHFVAGAAHELACYDRERARVPSLGVPEARLPAEFRRSWNCAQEHLWDLTTKLRGGAREAEKALTEGVVEMLAGLSGRVAREGGWAALTVLENGALAEARMRQMLCSTIKGYSEEHLAALKRELRYSEGSRAGEEISEQGAGLLELAPHLERHLSVMYELARYRCGCRALVARHLPLIQALVLDPPALSMVHAEIFLALSSGSRRPSRAALHYYGSRRPVELLTKRGAEYNANLLGRCEQVRLDLLGRLLNGLDKTSRDLELREQLARLVLGHGGGAFLDSMQGLGAVLATEALQDWIQPNFVKVAYASAQLRRNCELVVAGGDVPIWKGSYRCGGSLPCACASCAPRPLV